MREVEPLGARLSIIPQQFVVLTRTQFITWWQQVNKHSHCALRCVALPALLFEMQGASAPRCIQRAALHARLSAVSAARDATAPAQIIANDCEFRPAHCALCKLQVEVWQSGLKLFVCSVICSNQRKMEDRARTHPKGRKTRAYALLRAV